MSDNHLVTPSNKKLDAVETMVLVSSIAIIVAAAIFWCLQIVDVAQLLRSL